MGKIINRTRERSLESRRAQFMKEFEESKSCADYYKRRMQFQWKQHMLALELLDSVQEAIGIGPGSHDRIIPAIAQLKDAAQANAQTISEVESNVQQAYRYMQDGFTPLPQSATSETQDDELRLRRERVAICDALGLEPWTDLARITGAIKTLKAAVRQLREEPPAPKAVPIGQGQFEFDTLVIEINGGTSKVTAKMGIDTVYTNTMEIQPNNEVPKNLTLYLAYAGFKAVSNPVHIGDWSPKSHG